MSNVIQSSWPSGPATLPSTVTCICSFSFRMTSFRGRSDQRSRCHTTACQSCAERFLARPLRIFAWGYSEVHMAKASNAIPKGHHTVTPSLTLDNAAQAIDWYKKALGAEETSRAVGPDGKIMHAEIRVGDSPIMLMDAMMGMKGPKGFGGSPASLWLYVDDCDALFKRAVAAGGKVTPERRR